MKNILVVSVFALGASFAQASDSKKLSLVEMDLVTAGASASANGRSYCSTGVVKGNAGMVCGGGGNANSKGNHSENAAAGNENYVDGQSAILSSNLGGGTAYIAAGLYSGSSYTYAEASASSKKSKRKSRNKRKRGGRGNR